MAKFTENDSAKAAQVNLDELSASDLLGHFLEAHFFFTEHYDRTVNDAWLEVCRTARTAILKRME